MEKLHEEALAWFEERAGTTVPWPAPLPGSGLLVVQRAKGIHKPAGWAHALSVRVIPTGRYPDEEPQASSGGGWRFRYSQEEPSGQDPREAFTNRALDQCRLDGVPVGVLRQVSGKPSVRYEVLGLARVTDWKGGFFTLEGPFSMAGDPTTDALVGDDFDPSSIKDAREKTLAAIKRRRGQPAFRNALLAAYNGRCGISGCAIEPLLEAAHIVPYQGASTNVVCNGLLLRADLHTLFDLGFLWVAPDTLTAVVDAGIMNSSYGKLHGRPLRLPTQVKDRPSKAALQTRVPVRD